MIDRRIVLVTGSPRSGTTAVGQVLSLGRGVCVLHEPFNYHVGLKSVRRYFEIPGSGGFTEADLERIVGSIRRLRLRYKAGGFPADPGPVRLAKRLFGGRALNSYRRCRLSPGTETIVWKDPFACFFAPDLAENHDARVVVTLRNPWAVAASFKRMGWAFDLRDIESRLAEAGCPGTPKLDRSILESRDPVSNGAAIWTLVYGVLADAERRSPGRMRFLDMDRVLAEPLPTYAGLYRELDLPWSAAVEGRIRKLYSSGSDETAAPRSQRAHDRRRDLRAANVYWSQLLGEDEAEVVSEVSGAVWQRLEPGA